MALGQTVAQAVVDFLPNFKPIQEGFGQLSSMISGFSWGEIAGAAAGATAPIAAFASIISGPQGYATEIVEVNRWSGLGAKSLMQMKFASDQLNTDMGALTDGMARLNISLQDVRGAGSVANRTLERLGISGEHLKQMGTYDKLVTLADSFAGVENKGVRAQMAVDLFGRRGLAILPVLEQGGGRLREMRAQMEEFGISADPEQFMDFQNRMEQLNMSFMGLRTTLAQAILPTVIELVQWTQRITIRIKDWVAENKPLIRSIANIAVVASKALMALTGIEVSIKVIGKLVSPLFLVAAAIGLWIEFLTDANLGFNDLLKTVRIGGVDLQTWFQIAANTIYDAFSGLWEDLKFGFSEMFRNVTDKLIKWIKDILQSFDEVKKIIGLMSNEEVNRRIAEREDKFKNPFTMDYVPKTWEQRQKELNEKNRQLKQDSVNQYATTVREERRRRKERENRFNITPDLSGLWGGLNMPFVSTGMMVGTDFATQMGAFYGRTGNVEEDQLSVQKEMRNILTDVRDGGGFGV